MGLNCFERTSCDEQKGASGGLGAMHVRDEQLQSQIGEDWLR